MIKPMRQRDDFIRAYLLGRAIVLHFACFLRRMRASETAARKSA